MDFALKPALHDEFKLNYTDAFALYYNHLKKLSQTCVVIRI